MSLEPHASEIDEAGVQALVKTDLHVHAESTGRLLQEIERRRGWERHDHREIIDRVRRECEPRAWAPAGAESGDQRPLR